MCMSFRLYSARFLQSKLGQLRLKGGLPSKVGYNQVPWRSRTACYFQYIRVSVMNVTVTLSELNVSNGGDQM